MIHKLKLDLGVYTPLNRQPGTQRVIRKKSAGEYKRRESRYINSMRKRVNKFISAHYRTNCLPCLKANFPEDHRLNHHLCWVTWSFHAVHNAQSAHLWRKSHSSLVCSRSIWPSAISHLRFTAFLDRSLKNKIVIKSFCIAACKGEDKSAFAAWLCSKVGRKKICVWATSNRAATYLKNLLKRRHRKQES